MARILIIDDDATVRKVLCRILERGGHTVAEAGDGRTGLKLHAEQPADLIITDIFMPDQDGLETIMQLRKQSPGTKIICLSGGDSTGRMDLRRDAEQLGAQRTLRKPFELGEILEVVAEVLAAP